MQRYRVVAFETLFPIWQEQAQSRGGGVVFLPLDEPNWPTVVTGIVETHFRHHTARSVELGIATLDEDVLERFCHRYQSAYWQGGDEG